MLMTHIIFLVSTTMTRHLQMTGRQMVAIIGSLRRHDSSGMAPGNWDDDRAQMTRRLGSGMFFFSFILRYILIN